jgi:hypothetical protein
MPHTQASTQHPHRHQTPETKQKVIGAGCQGLAVWPLGAQHATIPHLHPLGSLQAYSAAGWCQQQVMWFPSASPSSSTAVQDGCWVKARALHHQAPTWLGRGCTQVLQAKQHLELWPPITPVAPCQPTNNGAPTQHLPSYNTSRDSCTCFNRGPQQYPDS